MQIRPDEVQALPSDRPSDSTRPNTSRTGAPPKSAKKPDSLATFATSSSSPIVSARIAFRIKRSVRDEAPRRLTRPALTRPALANSRWLTLPRTILRRLTPFPRRRNDLLSSTLIRSQVALGSVHAFAQTKSDAWERWDRGARLRCESAEGRGADAALSPRDRTRRQVKCFGRNAPHL